MTSPSLDRSGRRPAALQTATVLTLLTFGCTTVRAPASAIAPTVPVRAGVSDPQIELWLESAREVSPEESAQAAADAHAALRQALAGRQVPDGDAILVVRAQGVSRTRSRRNDQRAAMAGIVVGAVALVAVVVVALVASKGSSGAKAPRLRGGSRIAPRVRAGPAIPAVRPSRAGPIPVAAAPRTRDVPQWRLPARPGARSARGGVGANVNPTVLVPGSPPAAEQHHQEEPDLGPWEAPFGEPPIAAEEVAFVTLPPLRPLDLEKRGFFERDLLRLELALVDRHSGVVLWTKTVEDDADARDADAVRKVLDRALAEPSGWVIPAPDQAAY